MTIQQLRCFTVMAETLHYTKAASRLFISQPSLSYSISELEKELGVPLFQRQDNKTHLTRYGQELLPYAQAALDSLDAVKNKASELLDPSTGSIGLGSIYSISFDFLPRLLERFYSDRENGQVTVRCVQDVHTALTEKLMAGELDLVLSGETRLPDFSCVRLFTQELRLVVPERHHLAQREAVTLEDVAQEGLISLGPQSNITTHIANCFRARGLTARFVLDVAECSAMGAFISSGMGLAIAPVIPSFHSTSVRIVPFAPPDRELLGRSVCLQWVKDRHLPPAARRLRDFILTECDVKA